MVKFCCLSALVGRKELIEKEEKESLNNVSEKKLESLQVNFERLNAEEMKPVSSDIVVTLATSRSSRNKVKVLSHDSPIGNEIDELAYEGEDEHDENVSMKRDLSDCELQAHFYRSGENDESIKTRMNIYNSFETESCNQSDDGAEKDDGETIDIIQSGHVSDPGTRKVEFWTSPQLKRSCSNLETRSVLKKIAEQTPLSKFQSYEGMPRFAERMTEVVPSRNHESPASVTSHRSADKVLLKKHSSTQILPSRSRKLWWKLFLWSHRNLHEAQKTKQLLIKPPLNQQGGYSSDTLEPNKGISFGSPISCYSNKGKKKKDNQTWDVFTGMSGLLPHNHWVAFSTESSSMTQVDEWVKDVSCEHQFLIDNDVPPEDGIVFPPSPENDKSLAKTPYQLSRHQDLNLPEHILHANSVIRSLNSSSTVAHISGVGLKVIPAISRFSSLRSVNLSANYIVHITPGSLPKGLHTLNLSRNKISTIEGLKELTRLRALDLSYNRISRIGQGLSNCTMIKELYLAGNKISDVEGLHRLLKLTILDLSFNKITTTKALGQIVANYNSLLALNLLGNPLQNNLSDDQLRKAVCGLLPKVAYLNKQPINTQKAREMASESIARAALGSGDKGTRRKTVKRVRESGSSSYSSHKSSVMIAKKSRHRLKTRTHLNSPLQK